MQLIMHTPPSGNSQICQTYFLPGTLASTIEFEGDLLAFYTNSISLDKLNKKIDLLRLSFKIFGKIKEEKTQSQPNRKLRPVEHASVGNRRLPSDLMP